MKFFQELQLVESHISAQKEADHVISVVNSLYAEWKKTGRRKNAVDIITATANKLSNIDPAVAATVHEATRLKIATLLVRCFDIPYWKNAGEKERLYKKLFPLIQKFETYDPKVESGGNVREVILTRLSSSIAYNSESKTIFVAYESRVSDAYLRYLFGKELPVRTYKMQAMPLPANFDSLVDVLKINHQKAVDKYAAEKATASSRN